MGVLDVQLVSYNMWLIPFAGPWMLGRSALTTAALMRYSASGMRIEDVERITVKHITVK
jgi:hypothetical protein